MHSLEMFKLNKTNEFVLQKNWTFLSFIGRAESWPDLGSVIFWANPQLCHDYPVKILCNSVFFIKRVIRVLLILGSLSVCRILETLGKLTQNTYISIPLYKQFYGLFPLNLFYILGTFFLKLEIWKYTCIFSESCK